MGIKGLSKVIADHAPSALKEHDIKAYFGRKIAIDASMSIYQFLIAVRTNGQMLASDSGDATGHLIGLFYRTIRMVENGIKPVYVFDGKPPEMKSGELEKRHERREEAEKGHAAAVEAGDTEAVDKFSRRLVKVTREHNDECKRLLKLMGVPYVEVCACTAHMCLSCRQAPCEAEAQCAELVKRGVVFATATEDMDGLTFGTNVLLRHLTASEAKKLPITEYHLDKVLTGLQLTTAEFVDLCILLGCDYCGTIRGIGPKKAVELIKQYKSIEVILDNIDHAKFPPPDPWHYKESRRLFFEPEVTNGDDVSLKWIEPDEQGLVDFLSTEKNFAEDRVRNGAAKLLKSRQATTQGRIDTFFKMSTPKTTTTPTTPASAKRKALEDKNKSSTGKKAKAGGPPKRGK